MQGSYLYMSTRDCTGEVNQKRDFIYFNLKWLGEPDVEGWGTPSDAMNSMER
jgi:hypothetical protein